MQYSSCCLLNEPTVRNECDIWVFLSVIYLDKSVIRLAVGLGVIVRFIRRSLRYFQAELLCHLSGESADGDGPS